MRRRIWRAAKWALVGALGLVTLVLGGGLSQRNCWLRRRRAAIQRPSRSSRRTVLRPSICREGIGTVDPVRGHFNSLSAPRKEMVIIAGGGHNVATTKSDDFLNLLVDRVKPLTGD